MAVSVIIKGIRDIYALKEGQRNFHVTFSPHPTSFSQITPKGTDSNVITGEIMIMMRLNTGEER